MIKVILTNHNNEDIQNVLITYDGTWNEFKKDVLNGREVNVVDSTMKFGYKQKWFEGRKILNCIKNDKFHLYLETKRFENDTIERSGFYLIK